MTEKEFFEQFSYDPDKDLLGSGGFGSVYRAYDKRENRYVAIKISQVKDLYGKFTLLNEVELSRKIDDHTNVARYEFGLRIKIPFPVDYAVMAYYEEGNLEMFLRKKHGKLSEKERYEIVEGLLEGIGHLHNENVIHRDLKLANILMHQTRQGQLRPKIADFGLSRMMEGYDASVSNSAIGITVAYAAPEQIENKPIRRNVDLWAIGVIIYRIITLEMPFVAEPGVDSTVATLEISRKITRGEMPEKLNSIPEPFQSIIRRCLVKDNRDRVQSASELLDILKGKSSVFTPQKKNILEIIASFQNKNSTETPDQSLKRIPQNEMDATLYEAPKPNLEDHEQSAASTLIFSSENETQIFTSEPMGRMESPKPEEATLIEPKSGWGVVKPAKKGGILNKLRSILGIRRD